MPKKIKDPSFSNERYTIQVLQKALRILDTLLEAQQPLGLEALSERSETPKSTTFRLITNLVNGDYLTETPDGYWLGLKLLSMGTAVEAHLDVRRVAEPYIKQLRDQTGETVYLATLMQDMRVLYLERAASTQPVAVMLKSAGMTAEAHASGLGKAMLAFKPEAVRRKWLAQADLVALTANTITNAEALECELTAIRERGYATDREEFMLTICCIAAPVFDAHQRPIAAISVAGPKHRMPDPLVDSDIARQVVDIAHQISARMGLSLHLTTNGSAS
ncbi:MAG: IclR family transcriptional regulator [Anaerolineae bacterium]|nr:IclR family transcriptional regulator [Anaerolineae bacterium]